MQCQAKTNWMGKEQCSRAGKVKINGIPFCIPHAGKICLQRSIKDGVVEPINPDDWFYKKIIEKTVETVALLRAYKAGAKEHSAEVDGRILSEFCRDCKKEFGHPDNCIGCDYRVAQTAAPSPLARG